MHLIKNRIAAVAVGAGVLVAAGGIGGATAASGHLPWNTVGTHQVRNDSVRSVDIHNGTVRLQDLSQFTQNHLRGQQGPAGPAGADGVDGKDGANGIANVAAGSEYTSTWAGDQGAKLHETIMKCSGNQVALGGGYSTFGGDSKDLGGDNGQIQVTVSAPSFEGAYQSVNNRGDFLPTEWVVRGYNYGSTDQVVRAWVVCADAQ